MTQIAPEVTQDADSSGVAPAFVPVAADIKIAAPRRVKTRGRTSRGRFVVHDVTGLVPGEPVRYGLVHRVGVARHPALVELEGLIKATKLGGSL